MPKFIDAHPMKPFTADALNKLQNAPPDEFGVTHHDILFNEKGNKIYCVLDAPDVEAIEKHHAKAGQVGTVSTSGVQDGAVCG